MADSLLDVSELNRLTLGFAAESVAAVFKGSQAVRSTAQRVVATAQQFVSVDTSATKQSIHASGPGGAPLTVGSLEAEMGPTTEYAPHLEHGTVKMPPYAFMGPALDRHTPDFVTAVGQISGLGL